MSYDLACIGTSWGGLHAVRTLVEALPRGLPMAVLIVQHRHRESGTLLPELLQECSALPVSEVEDKDPLSPGVIHVAPANYHLLIEDGCFALTTDAPVRFSRPSIDVTFESVADELGRRAIGVVLTGANQDGAEGLRRIVDRGGHAIVQDPDTAESPIMPRAALRAVPEAARLPLEAIAAELVHLGRGPAASAVIGRSEGRAPPPHRGDVEGRAR